MRGCWKWPGFSSILAFQGEEEQKVEKKGRNKLRGDFGLRRMLVVKLCFCQHHCWCPKFCFSIIYMDFTKYVILPIVKLLRYRGLTLNSH